MAFRRTQPLTVGEITRLRVPRGCTVIVDAPDGLQLRMPAPNGTVDLWVPQAGEWRVSWPGGDTTLEVADAAAPATLSIHIDAEQVKREIGQRAPMSVLPRQYRGGR